jgi:hypothetical protein
LGGAMGSLNGLLERVGAEIVKKGSIILIDRKTAMTVLSICAEEQIRVLGVEAFFAQGSNIIPVIDAIGDFSNASSKSESIEDARNFIHSIERQDLMFELELEDKEEE